MGNLDDSVQEIYFCLFVPKIFNYLIKFLTCEELFLKLLINLVISAHVNFILKPIQLIFDP